VRGAGFASYSIGSESDSEGIEAWLVWPLGVADRTSKAKTRSFVAAEYPNIGDMSPSRERLYPLRVLFAAPLLTICFALVAKPAEKLYSPKNADDVEIISQVLGAETKANNWTKQELICITVDGKDPNKKLLKDLRQDGLNVRSLGEWQVKFSCGFHVYLRIMNSDAPQVARIRAEVADVREINRGEGDLAILVRKGEYSLHRTEGKWIVAEYVPAK
jgi:hypothetical protein